MRIPGLTLLLLAAIAAPAQAGTFAVDRGDDPIKEGGCTADCSLRDALVKTNAAKGPDTITQPAPGERPIAQTPDTTRPRLRVRGIPKTITRKAFNAGLKVRVSADEPIAAEVSLLAGSPRRLLAARSLALAPGARTVTLKPRRKLTGSKAIRARVRVVAIDGSANPSAKRITFRVR